LGIRSPELCEEARPAVQTRTIPWPPTRRLLGALRLLAAASRSPRRDLDRIMADIELPLVPVLRRDGVDRRAA